MSYQRNLYSFAAWVGTAMLFLCTGALTAQVSFQAGHYVGASSQTHADFNNDGREDFVIQNGSFGNATFALINSTGDGTYGPPRTYSVPNPDNCCGDFVVGDFNHDGKADLIFSSGSNGEVYEYLGNGDGTLRSPILILTLPSNLGRQLRPM